MANQKQGSFEALIPMLLQVEQFKLNERNAVVQEEQLAVLQRQQQATVMGEFAKSLETIRDPVQLSAYKDFYATNFGIDRGAIDDFTNQYLPTLSAQRAGAAHSGTSAMSDPARQAYNTAAAFQNIVGQGQGTVAVDQNIAADPNKVKTSAAVQAGTGLSARDNQQESQFARNMTQNLMQMQLNRDIAQSGDQIQIRGQNLQNVMSSRQYALGLLPYELAKAGKGGVGGDGWFSKPEDQAKYLLDLIQEQNKGGSDLTKALLDGLIRKNAGPLFPGQQIPQNGTFAPGFTDRLFR